MRTLTIIRHAKSSWADEGLTDFERPLNERGRRDAPIMAARLQQAVGQPNLLVSSPALRAITTARVFADVLGISTDSIALNAKIYDASVGTLMQIVQNMDAQYAHIALFGHNPGLSELSQRLARCDFSELPTCGMAHIVFDVDDWRDISANSGTLRYSSWPKDPRAL